MLEDQVEYYENKEGLEKHQAEVEAGKTVDMLTQEIEQLLSLNDKSSWVLAQFSCIYI